MTGPGLRPLRGRVCLVLGDNFDIDQLVGVENIKVQALDALVDQVMLRCGEDFRQRVRPGDFLVGGDNFGYGHPHYQAMRAMRSIGIAGVLANSFAPLYWRGEISNGFPQFACDGVAAWLKAGDEIEMDFVSATVTARASGEVRHFQPYSRSEREILQAGGFRPWLARSIT